MRSAHISRSLAALVAAGLLLTGCGSQSADVADDKPSAAPTTEEPSTEPEAEEEESEPEEEVILDYGDNSEQVRELQARLDQLDHFAGQPTGYFGEVTVGAVSDYQEAAELEVSGTVYESTWAQLTEQTTEPTQDDMFPKQLVMGYGDNSDQVRELQARLAQLDHFADKPTGYYGDATSASVTSYQQAAGLEVSGSVYEPTWERLTQDTSMPSAEDMNPPLEVPEVETPTPEGLDDRCMTGRALCISKTTNTLTWVVDGEVRMAMDVRFGTEEYPTREGQFDVYWKSRHHHSTLYDSPMPYALFFDGGQAVHYSENFAANGYEGGSYGCVNVRDEAAIDTLFNEVKEGDKVVVHW